MKKHIFTTLRSTLAIAASVLLIGLSGCNKESAFSENYDIPWPYPTVTEINPTKALIDTEITLKGTNLEKASTVLLGRNKREAEIISASATELRIRVPRTVNAGPVYVKNLYNRATTSTVIFEPEYPTSDITGWPAVIFRGQPFKLKGTNMDLISSVTLNGEKIAVEGSSGTQTEISIMTEGLTLPEQVVIVVEARGGVTNGTSPSIPVQDFDPNAKYDPAPAIVILDFEDGLNPFVAGDITPQNGMNLSGTVKGRGEKYLSIKENNVPDPWGTNIGTLTMSNINLADFHEPHLTFMINTNGNDGYFQMEMVQGGNKDGGHFTPSSSSNPSDNYKFHTTGWEWRSIDLANFKWEDWGGDGLISFDKKGIIDQITFGFKQGNGVNPYDISLDQIMITDGPRKVVQALWNFEDGIDPYSGSATSGINLAGHGTIGGNNYLTVKVDQNVNSWNWTGQIDWNTQTINLSGVASPYLSMMVNTGGRQGYFQVETTQDGTKWGIGQTAGPYFFETVGEWTLVNLPLTAQAFGNWGGSGTEFDPAGIMDYLKIGFTTGNVADQPYQLSVDEVYISDGPLY